MTWWESCTLTVFMSFFKVHFPSTNNAPCICCSLWAMLSSSWHRCVKGHTTSIYLRTRTRSLASVRRSLCPTWSSEVSKKKNSAFDFTWKCHQWLAGAGLCLQVHTPALCDTDKDVCNPDQVQMRRPLKITLRNTSGGTLKDLVKI